MSNVKMGKAKRRALRVIDEAKEARSIHLNVESVPAEARTVRIQVRDVPA